jgi:hypothetical protein
MFCFLPFFTNGIVAAGTRRGGPDGVAWAISEKWEERIR